MAFDPVTAALVLTAIAGGASAVQQRKAGKAQAAALKQQAREEETQARERELARKQKINKILAAQIVGMGASGIGAEGTPQLIAEESVRQESLEGLADVATRAGRERSLLNQARTARSLGNLQAATTLLSTAGNVGITKARLD